MPCVSSASVTRGADLRETLRRQRSMRSARLLVRNSWSIRVVYAVSCTAYVRQRTHARPRKAAAEAAVADLSQSSPPPSRSRRGRREVSARNSQLMIGGRGLNAHKVVASAWGVERYSRSGGARAIGTDPQRWVVPRSTEHSLVRATLTEVNGPRVYAARRCVSEHHHNLRGSPLHTRCHGSRSVHLHGARKLRRAGDARVPAAVESYVRGLHLDRRLLLEHGAGTERERCGEKSQGSNAFVPRYFNGGKLHGWLQLLLNDSPGAVHHTWSGMRSSRRGGRGPSSCLGRPNPVSAGYATDRVRSVRRRTVDNARMRPPAIRGASVPSASAATMKYVVDECGLRSRQPSERARAAGPAQACQKTSRTRSPACSRTPDDPRATSGRAPVRSTNRELDGSWLDRPRLRLTLSKFLPPASLSHRPWLSRHQRRPSSCS